MLHKFRQAKQEEIVRLREQAEAGRLPALFKGKRPSFTAAIRAKARPAIIAEYKRASPSRGEINLRMSPEEVALLYAGGGAAAISCLTERRYFKGSLEFVALMAGPGLPILRKDFLFDPLQIRATAATPASAALLIVRMFPPDRNGLDSAPALADMISLCRELALDPVVEVFDQADLSRAREAGADIIQVNTRDLDTLEVDPGNAFELIKGKGQGELWIAASGIRDEGDVAALGQAGYDALLVGTALMESGNPGRKLAELTGRTGSTGRTGAEG